MSDRDLLLLACLKQPDDLTARLVYADWLDDHPELPGAEATAEFIRLSCRKPRKGARVAPERDAWLAANWKRLIPSVVALSVPRSEPWPFSDDTPWSRVKGRDLYTSVILPGNIRYRDPVTSDGVVVGTRLYPCSLRLTFTSGLCSWWKMPSDWGRKQVEPALKADRPELFLEPVRESQVPDSGT